MSRGYLLNEDVKGSKLGPGDFTSSETIAVLLLRPRLGNITLVTNHFCTITLKSLLKYVRKLQLALSEMR